MDGATPNLRAGTPKYMAPEQAAGAESQIGVQSDVYALGVMLHELLTGETPAQHDGLSDEAHGESAHAYDALSRRHAPRDLRAICQKCLKPRPADRYASAQELSDDLRRYLAFQPVTARALGLGERLRYWRRRHPAVSSLSVGLTISLALGGMVAAWQYRRAERQFVETEAATAEAQRIRSQAENALVDLAWLVEESAMWTQESLAFEAAIQTKLTQYQNAAAHDPLAPFGAVSIAAVTGSLSARTAAHSGDLPSAAAHYQQAIDLWRPLVEKNPDNAGYRRAFALCVLSFARLRCEMDRAAGRADELSGARQLLTELTNDQYIPADCLKEFIVVAVDSGYKLSIELPKEPAKETCSLGRIGVEALVNRVGRLPELLFYEGQFSRLIGIQWERLRNAEQALKEFERAQLVLRQAVQADPATSIYQRELARAYRVSGVLCRERHNFSQAREELAPAVEVLTRLVAKEPRELDLKNDLAKALRDLGIVENRLDNNKTAYAAFGRAHELWAEIERQRRLGETDRKQYSHVCHEEALLALAYGDATSARQAAADGIRLFKESAKQSSFTPREQFDWAECIIVAADFQAQDGDIPGAIRVYEETISWIKPMALAPNANARFKNGIVNWRKSLATLKAQAE
jgi:tetratricopeptide (TPR) repeat protein